MSITGDVVEFNGGGLGGLVKVMDLTTKLNNLEHLVIDLVTMYNTHTHSGGTISGYTGVPAILETGTLSLTNAEEITNDRITQG